MAMASPTLFICVVSVGFGLRKFLEGEARNLGEQNQWSLSFSQYAAHGGFRVWWKHYKEPALHKMFTLTARIPLLRRCKNQI